MNNGADSFLVYSPHGRDFTGGPRSVISFLGAFTAERSKILVITRIESELSRRARDLGFECMAILAEGEGAKGGLPGMGRIIAFGRGLRGVWVRARGARVQAIWTRSLKGVVGMAPLGLALRVPIIWDIGVEGTRSKAFRPVNLLALLTVGAVVTQGRSVGGELFGDRRAVKSRKLRVLTPPVPPDRAAKMAGIRTRERVGQRATIVNVGTLNRRKNQLLLIEALPAICKSVRHVRVVLVGQDGTEGYLGEIRRRARELGVEHRIEYRGWCSEVSEVFEEADILVHTARAEGLPHVIREAMVAGVPIVTSNVGAIGDIVVHGRTGIIYESDDQVGLVEAAVTMLKDEELRRKIGGEARQDALRLFDYETWAAAYARVLEDVVAS